MVHQSSLSNLNLKEKVPTAAMFLFLQPAKKEIFFKKLCIYQGFIITYQFRT
jgi:hypothetical protein